MKFYFSAVIIAVLVLTITLFANDNKDTKKVTTKDSKSCCAGMVKEAKMTSKDVKTDSKTMSKDECADMAAEHCATDVAKAKMSKEECKDMTDANCDMDMAKAKNGEKMDCCKTDGKMTEAKTKTETKKTTETKPSNK